MKALDGLGQRQRLVYCRVEFVEITRLPGRRDFAIVGVMALRDLPIRVDEDKVAEFCRARGIRRLRLFGSVLREGFDPTRSDVDVLAEFHPKAVRNSGWEFFLYGEQLGEIFGYKADLCTNLRPWLRRIVQKQAITIYDEKASSGPDARYAGVWLASSGGGSP